MYSPALFIHICGGIVGVLSGSTALVARKGARLHRKSGDVFVISMLTMAAAGAYVAFTKSQPTNVIAGVFTFYLVATAWLTVKRSANETGRLEHGLLALGLAAAAGSLLYGWQVAHGLNDSVAGNSAVPFVVFGSVALLSVAGDIRVLNRGGVAGAKRLVRHLWRMCVALLIAAGSFFLGMASDPVLRQSGLRATLFTPAIRSTHLPELPVLIIALLTIYWLCRVWFTNAYKKGGARIPAKPSALTQAAIRSAQPPSNLQPDPS